MLDDFSFTPFRSFSQLQSDVSNQSSPLSLPVPQTSGGLSAPPPQKQSGGLGGSVGGFLGGLLDTGKTFLNTVMEIDIAKRMQKALGGQAVTSATNQQTVQPTPKATQSGGGMSDMMKYGAYAAGGLILLLVLLRLVKS